MKLVKLLGFHEMNDLFSIGYFRDNDDESFRINFSDDGPLAGKDMGPGGAVFNLSDNSVRASGSSSSVEQFSFSA